MKPKLLFACAGAILTSSMMLAQQPTSSSGTSAKQPVPEPAMGSTVLTIDVPDTHLCPVGLQAKQGFGNGLVKVRHAPDVQPDNPNKPGQHIHLIVTQPADKPSGPQVVGATVTARGLSARPRVDKASGSGSSNVRRTLNVKFDAAADGSLSAEIDLPGFTAVRSIKIEALEYADRSTRDLAGLKVCTVAPDPLMLVAER